MVDVAEKHSSGAASTFGGILKMSFVMSVLIQSLIVPLIDARIVLYSLIQTYTSYNIIVHR